MRYGEMYLQHVREIGERVFREQSDAMEKAAAVMADAIAAGRTLYAFGCSHAGILVEELFYRTGGLALINPLFNPTLMLNTRPVTLTSRMERLEGFGREIVASSPLGRGDVILIHSVSGRNPASIDAALEAARRGAYVIALTNLAYSRQVTSRHSSGKNLYQLADLVIDNCGDFEDAAIAIPGLEQKVAPTSTAVGALIVNAILVELVAKLVERGIAPPVFHSANVDGGDEYNQRIFAEYRDRIHYL
ncbi:putative phosphosugar-binding protein [Hydrogenispora ethanolica]|uniref:Putative phosphosugar-binding protein n=1 Tax=Hydrogenispora ethanolica TaxID=1082276 RepID=A0A4R1RZZ2_HYDET|nr:SIS domain-containing protein [Hydrogenispora ethanolica]TCL71582.1 putative phosphosugar-binding protein [Hydrogenispora ethanolica]